MHWKWSVAREMRVGREGGSNAKRIVGKLNVIGKIKGRIAFVRPICGKRIGEMTGYRKNRRLKMRFSLKLIRILSCFRPFGFGPMDVNRLSETTDLRVFF